jgi:uncharacterized membrane protein/cytochrome c556
MINVIRLVTVHPVFVHFTVGILPVIVFAYAVALWFKSERWSFVGDVATAVCAAITLLTMSFGLISNFYLLWPGGLWFWHYLHMGFGIGSTAALVIFAASRLIMRQRGAALSGAGALAASVFLSILIGATGWIGGEILVYTSGMAVQAAGNGAFAPVGMGGTGTPANFPDAMGRTRAAWASITTQVAEMIVHHPSDAAFLAVAEDAQRLQRVANWISTEAPKRMPGANKPMNSSSIAGQSQTIEATMTRGQMMARMGAQLEDDAQTVAQSARRKDLKQLAKEVGTTSELCAGCHEELRWRKRGE